MESGFKRLWKRKKSKGTGDSSRAVSSADHMRPGSAVAKECGRASVATSRIGDKPSSGGVTTSNGNYLSFTASDLPRTKSGNRIQPILIGISRPSDPNPRPETAVSLNTAVQRAADSARTSQDAARIQSASAAGHRRSASGRSIDIFKVTGLQWGLRSRYNEEVATRNLDWEARAGGAESSPGYVPTSRYQEEVADRNASGLYGSRTSLDYERATSLTSATVRSAVSPPLVPLSPRRYNGLLSKTDPDQSAYHSRQYSVRSRDGSHQVTGSSLERVSEDESLRDGFVRQAQGPRSVPHSTLPGRRNVNAMLTAKPLPRLPIPPRENDFVSQEDDISPILSTMHRDDELANAMLRPGVAPQPPTRHPARTTVSRTDTNQRVPPARDGADLTTKPLSMVSSSSAKRVSLAGDRKTRDSATDELYSESSSTYGYSQYSPILQQANTGRFEHTSRPHRVNSSDHIHSTDDEPRDEPVIQTASVSSKPLVTSVVDGIAHEPRTALPQTAKNISQAIAFSPINTLASVTPRSSLDPSWKHALTSTDGPSEASTISHPEPRGQDGPDVVVSQSDSTARALRLLQKEETMSRVQRAAAALEARSASQSPNLGPNEALKRRSIGATSATSGTTSTSRSRSPARVEEKLSLQNSNHSKAHTDSAISLSTVTARRSASTPSGVKSIPPKQASLTAGSVHATPSIYDSPDSLRSVDYTNPGSSFGVRTRDFAVTPVKSAISLRKKSDPQLLKKTATGNAYKAISEARKPDSAPVTKPAPAKTVVKKASKASTKRSASATYVPVKSEFDEEAFARKQAEAKAALLRLQQSLQEDFITLPVPVRPRKKSQAENDGSPVAPSSIVYPQSILTQSPSRPGTSRSISQNHDTTKPPSSFRSAPVSHDRAPSASSVRSRGAGGVSARKVAPATLKNVEAAAVPINHAFLPPSLQNLLLSSSNPPRSPGEISLSSFPLPSSRPGSEHDTTTSFARPGGFGHMRRNSTKSQASVASQFSIPFSMIPDRSSSYRDTVIEEDSS